MLAGLCEHVLMSEEGYIKAPCHECHGRISLPQDAVGVDFNCPHCGVGLQMLLKHICEHCGGKLSFDGTPEAIGMEIECGHCHNSTVLKPTHKTRELHSQLEDLLPKEAKTVLMVTEEANDNLDLAARNIPWVELAEAVSLNTYQVLRPDVILISQGGLEQVAVRLKAK